MHTALHKRSYPLWKYQLLSNRIQGTSILKTQGIESGDTYFAEVDTCGGDCANDKGFKLLTVYLLTSRDCIDDVCGIGRLPSLRTKVGDVSLVLLAKTTKIK